MTLASPLREAIRAVSLDPQYFAQYLWRVYRAVYGRRPYKPLYGSPNRVGLSGQPRVVSGGLERLRGARRGLPAASEPISSSLCLASPFGMPSILSTFFSRLLDEQYGFATPPRSASTSAPPARRSASARRRTAASRRLVAVVAHGVGAVPPLPDAGKSEKF